MDFEVWRQRCSQGAPKASPRHFPGSNLREKGPQMETKCDEKVVFFEVQLKAKCYRMRFLRLARLGGKTYGGCLLDASQMLPRCLPDVYQMSPRRLPDVSQTLLSEGSKIAPTQERTVTSGIFRDLKNRPKKPAPRSQNGDPKLIKFDKRSITCGP